jgi:putative flippase GtrA
MALTRNHIPVAAAVALPYRAWERAHPSSAPGKRRAHFQNRPKRPVRLWQQRDPQRHGQARRPPAGAIRLASEDVSASVRDGQAEPSRPAPSPLTREVVKFAMVGGAGVAVNLLVFNLLRHTTSIAVVRASIAATVVSIIFNYVGFRYFAYRDRDKSCCTREIGLFLVFSAIGLVIENGVLALATYGFGWDSPLENNIFKFAGIAFATLFRFWSYRSWVFRVIPRSRGTAR